MTETDEREGVIIKGVGGLYYARGTDGQTYVLRARGIFRRRKITPLVGDRIIYTPASGDEHGWVEDVLPRESELIRPPVANVRYIALVFAPKPEPDMLLLDTLMIMAFKEGITPIIVINKCDLDSGALTERVCREYAQAGVSTIGVSALTGDGLDALRELLKQGICCFAGQSGVGKSTLMSAATGLKLQTGEISRKISRGKNTTRHVELITEGEFKLLDTPGFSLLELWEGLEPVKLKEYYPEFEQYEGKCRFSPCYHLSEPDCAVLEAMRQGKLQPGRLDRYHELLKKTTEAWKKRYD